MEHDTIKDQIDEVLQALSDAVAPSVPKAQRLDAITACGNFIDSCFGESATRLCYTLRNHGGIEMLLSLVCDPVVSVHQRAMMALANIVSAAFDVEDSALSREMALRLGACELLVARLNSQNDATQTYAAACLQNLSAWSNECARELDVGGGRERLEDLAMGRGANDLLVRYASGALKNIYTYLDEAVDEGGEGDDSMSPLPRKSAFGILSKVTKLSKRLSSSPSSRPSRTSSTERNRSTSTGSRGSSRSAERDRTSSMERRQKIKEAITLRTERDRIEYNMTLEAVVLLQYKFRKWLNKRRREQGRYSKFRAPQTPDHSENEVRNRSVSATKLQAFARGRSARRAHFDRVHKMKSPPLNTYETRHRGISTALDWSTPYSTRGPQFSPYRQLEFTTSSPSPELVPFQKPNKLKLPPQTLEQGFTGSPTFFTSQDSSDDIGSKKEVLSRSRSSRSSVFDSRDRLNSLVLSEGDDLLGQSYSSSLNNSPTVHAPSNPTLFSRSLFEQQKSPNASRVGRSTVGRARDHSPGNSSGFKARGLVEPLDAETLARFRENSAIKVQSLARGKSMRQNFSRQKRAAKQVQAMTRGNSARKLAHGKRNEISAKALKRQEENMHEVRKELQAVRRNMKPAEAEAVKAAVDLYLPKPESKLSLKSPSANITLTFKTSIHSSTSINDGKPTSKRELLGVRIDARAYFNSNRTAAAYGQSSRVEPPWTLPKGGHATGLSPLTMRVMPDLAPFGSPLSRKNGGLSETDPITGLPTFSKSISPPIISPTQRRAQGLMRMGAIR